MSIPDNTSIATRVTEETDFCGTGSSYRPTYSKQKTIQYYGQASSSGILYYTFGLYSHLVLALGIIRF
jgi:hypothetical protein